MLATTPTTMLATKPWISAAAALAFGLAACSSSLDTAAPWQPRASDGGPDAAAAVQTTLGTPFVIDAQEISDPVSASVQIASAKSGDPEDEGMQTLGVEHAEIVLRSDGFAVALESLALRLAPFDGDSCGLRLESTRAATGSVLAADPDALRVEFDLPLRLVVKGEAGEEQETISDEEHPVRLVLDVRRQSDEASLGVSMGEDGATWKVGAVHFRARAIAIEVRGPIEAPPADR